MPRRLVVPAGTRFGRLTVIGEAEPAVQPSGKVVRRLECGCDCGNKVGVRVYHLLNGNTQSCGCLHTEKVKQANWVHGQALHGKRSHVYKLWCNIKARSVTGSAATAHDYLGRGITMYEPWVSSFEMFNAWVNDNLGERPEGCSLDRVDNNGNYTPGNLRWATRKEQNNNTRNNRFLVVNGVTLTCTQWAEEVGISTKTLRSRLFRSNWPVEKALTTPVRRCSRAN